MKISIEVANKRIKNNFFKNGEPVYIEETHCSVGALAIRFSNRFCIVAQEINSSVEGILETALIGVPSIFENDNKAHVFKELALVLGLRREVVNLSVDDSFALKLELASGYQYSFPTDLKAVDWAWSIQRDSDMSDNPYAVEHLVCNLNVKELEASEKFTAL